MLKPEARYETFATSFTDTSIYRRKLEKCKPFNRGTIFTEKITEKQCGILFR